MKNALLEVGELDQALDDVIGLIQQVESDLGHFTDVYGDPRHLELHLRQIDVGMP